MKESETPTKLFQTPFTLTRPIDKTRSVIYFWFDIRQFTDKLWQLLEQDFFLSICHVSLDELEVLNECRPCQIVQTTSNISNYKITVETNSLQTKCPFKAKQNKTRWETRPSIWTWKHLRWKKINNYFWPIINLNHKSHNFFLCDDCIHGWCSSLFTTYCIEYFYNSFLGIIT